MSHGSDGAIERLRTLSKGKVSVEPSAEATILNTGKPKWSHYRGSGHRSRGGGRFGSDPGSRDLPEWSGGAGRVLESGCSRA